MTNPQPDEIERALERFERMITGGAGTFEAPSGKIMARIWIVDLAKVVKLARAALTNTPERDGQSSTLEQGGGDASLSQRG